MKVFDKAQWHIDNGANAQEVVAKFKAVFSFLNAHNMLSEDGIEIYEFGIDSSVSLNEKTVTKGGFVFLSNHYDEVINYTADAMVAELERRYFGE